MENKTLRVIKQTSKLVVTVGVGAIVGNAVKYTTPTTGVGTIMKACIGVGSLVLGGVASKACADYCDESIDGFAKTIKDVLDNAEFDTDVEVLSEA